MLYLKYSDLPENLRFIVEGEADSSFCDEKQNSFEMCKPLPTRLTDAYFPTWPSANMVTTWICSYDPCLIQIR